MNNSAFAYGEEASAAAGGFLYMGSSEIRFDIAAGKTLIIGSTKMMGLSIPLRGRALLPKPERANWCLTLITMILPVR